MSLPSFLFENIILFLLCVWVFYLYVCLCTMCVPCTHKGQKSAPGFLRLELKGVRNYDIGSWESNMPGPLQKQ